MNNHFKNSSLSPTQHVNMNFTGFIDVDWSKLWLIDDQLRECAYSLIHVSSHMNLRSNEHYRGLLVKPNTRIFLSWSLKSREHKFNYHGASYQQWPSTNLYGQWYTPFRQSSSARENQPNQTWSTLHMWGNFGKLSRSSYNKFPLRAANFLTKAISSNTFESTRSKTKFLIQARWVSFHRGRKSISASYSSARNNNLLFNSHVIAVIA